MSQDRRHRRRHGGRHLEEKSTIPDWALAILLLTLKQENKPLALTQIERYLSKKKLIYICHSSHKREH